MKPFDPGPAGDRPPPGDRSPEDDAQRTGGDRPTMLRFAGAGMELAGIVLGAGFIGHLLDRNVFAMERPWGLIVGMLLGFAAAMGHLFVLAKRFNR